MAKILSIVGARPQFVKAALLCKRLRELRCEEILLHTGQHYDFNMSDIFFEELSLPAPDYYLGVGSGGHGEQTGKMLIEIEKVLVKEACDFVLVYGDTNSTLAGALAASKLHIPVAHVEAGLRSYNRHMPEEINRLVTDHVSTILFCPNTVSVENLQKEGFANIWNHGNLYAETGTLLPVDSAQPFVVNVGDVMYDIALKAKDSAVEKDVLEKFGVWERRFVLVTIHRPENTDVRENMENIWGALLDIARSGVYIFFPLHPRTYKVLSEFGMLADIPKHLILTDPISYREMVVMEHHAGVIITDSGGVQKEGYFFGTPCVIPRGETEWTELVEHGWNVLSGASRERIREETFRLLNIDHDARESKQFYGDGDACTRIAKILKNVISRGTHEQG